MEGLRRADTGAVTPAPGKGHRGETWQKSDAERDLIGRTLVTWVGFRKKVGRCIFIYFFSL